ncbi:MAG TPA: response regulator transcription factor [Patescibacteria group bacterium]|nr:response regulator transcription factor [Patescibacteria group bacterium]
MRILIIEDQESLAKLLKRGLEAEGFSVDYVTDGESGKKRLDMNHEDYNLVLLDLMLPKKDGMAICQELRKQRISIPIVMMTAKDGISDITSGLDIGADDYIIKPFSFEILLSRIRAILRRPKRALPQELRAKDLTINPVAKKVKKGDEEIQLTLKEFGILEYLMRNPGIALSREQILSNSWDFSFDSFANVVDVHITNIRKKIGDKNGKIIETVRGIGYRITS